MKKAWWALGIAAAVAAAGPASAQMFPVGLEVKGFYANPMGDFSDDDGDALAEGGVGFGIDATVDLAPGIGIYAGWTRTSFGSDSNRFGADNLDYVDSGIHAGGIFGVPLPLGGLTPFVRIGALYHNLELDSDAADEDDGSTDSFGYELGLGANFPLGQVITVVPEIGWRSYDAEPVDGADPLIKVRYLTAGIGLKFRF